MEIVYSDTTGILFTNSFFFPGISHWILMLRRRKKNMRAGNKGNCGKYLWDRVRCVAMFRLHQSRKKVYWVCMYAYNHYAWCHTCLHIYWDTAMYSYLSSYREIHMDLFVYPLYQVFTIYYVIFKFKQYLHFSDPWSYKTTPYEDGWNNWSARKNSRPGVSCSLWNGWVEHGSVLWFLLLIPLANWKNCTSFQLFLCAGGQVAPVGGQPPPPPPPGLPGDSIRRHEVDSMLNNQRDIAQTARDIK